MTSYRRTIIFGTEKNLDRVMRGCIPKELTIDGIGSLCSRTIKRGNVVVGRYSINQTFPYSGEVELSPRFQEITGYNPGNILSEIAKVF